MRVSKEKNDAAYDARDRKVFISEKQVLGNWISADEFRRVVVMDDGKAIFGDVYIERLPEVAPSFVEPENKTEKAEKVPAIAETPKPGYSFGDRVKFKDRK